ncbi:MIA protein, partial [Atractosteus spatula]|nr:MIA protein [Atractosteus spatula]
MLKDRGNLFWAGSVQGEYYGEQEARLGHFPSSAVEETHVLMPASVEVKTDVSPLAPDALSTTALTQAHCMTDSGSGIQPVVSLGVQTGGTKREPHCFPGHQPELDPLHTKPVPDSCYRQDFRDPAPHLHAQRGTQAGQQSNSSQNSTCLG